MDIKTTHGGKREGAGRKPTGRVRKTLTLTLCVQAAAKLESQGVNKSEYIERLIIADIAKTQ